MKALIGSDFQKHVIPLLKSAKRSIDICVYDWRWYQDQATHPVQQFNIALVNAINRGVQVRVVLNKGDILDTLLKVGAKARVLRDRRTVHAKLMIIDENTLVIGSHNYTRNAFTSNIETSVILEIPEDVTRFQEFFNNLYQI